MRFSLFYQGTLRSSGSRRDKHELRLHFHSQLAALWQRPPLSRLPYLLQNPSPVDMPTLLRPIGTVVFAPLVAAEYIGTVNLRVQLLRAGSPGAILSQAGDIDNRLKTLFDALSVPQQNGLPDPAALTSAPQPFFVLLEDDKLVSSVRVETAELLGHTGGADEVALFIDVETETAHRTRHNSWLS